MARRLIGRGVKVPGIECSLTRWLALVDQAIKLLPPQRPSCSAEPTRAAAAPAVRTVMSSSIAEIPCTDAHLHSMPICEETTISTNLATWTLPTFAEVPSPSEPGIRPDGTDPAVGWQPRNRYPE